MLFRKERLDWRYGITELVIVVAGVMIALGADQWVRGRADIGLEGRYLDDLAIDLRSDTAQLGAAIRLAESRASLGHSVLRAAAGDTILAPTDLVVFLERQFYFAFPAYSRTTMSDLMSTGNLRLIRDRELRRRLSEYYQTIDRLEQWTENWRLVQQDVERIMPELLPLRKRRSARRLHGQAGRGLGTLLPGLRSSSYQSRRPVRSWLGSRLTPRPVSGSRGWSAYKGTSLAS